MATPDKAQAVAHVPQVSKHAVPVTATVARKTSLARKMYEVEICPLGDERFPSFAAGQFIMVEVAPGVKRAYSVASVPSERGSLVLCVGTAPGGTGSKFFEALAVGDTVHLEMPYGVFTVKSFERPILFVATGSGIAPFRAMVPDLLANRFDRDLRLMFGVRSEADLFYAEQFAELSAQYSSFKFMATLSQPSEAWTGARGRVTAHLEQFGDTYLHHDVYVCGSKEMILDVRKLLVGKGVPPLSIKFEIFN